MIFNNIQDYLEGKVFSNSLIIKVAKEQSTIVGRFELLEYLVKGKKIIHLGCCDHLEIIENKIEKNIWLHKRLTNYSKTCFGIDINEKGITYLRNKLGYLNVEKADITKDEIPKITESNWDYLVMGEIIEHIENPVAFLKNIMTKYRLNIKKVIVTAPNAFCIQNYKNAKNNEEHINSDHKYWFTPYTLAKILTLSGFSIDEFYFVQEVNESVGLRAKIKIIPYLRRKILYKRLKKNPVFRSTIVMIASFK